MCQRSLTQHVEANMENSSPVEVDDAVATIIANVNFGEFAPEVAQGTFVVAQIHEEETASEEIQDEGDAFEEKNHDYVEEVDVKEEERPSTQKKQRKPRKRRTDEDGEYPDIKEWKPYINSLIDQGIQGYHKTPIPTYENALPTIQDYLKPDIIIWDLQKVFPEIVNGTTCPEINCSEQLLLYPIAYTYMMRILYDFEKPVLLVTSMLRCKNGREHRFLGYDPRILKQLPEPEKVPFVLFHKVGITRELFNSIMNQVSNGVKFGHIQDALRKNFMKAHLERQEAFEAAVQQYFKDNPDSSEVPKSFPSIKIKGPRNTFIGQCFLLGFKEKEYFYKLSMSQILADEWIKLDSLFKLPTNVGTNNKGVWKKEVDHLFYCQNEVGQVLTWQLTGQGSFDEVRDTLVSIRDRHQQIAKQLKGCCTDSCCEWRDQLMSIFGAEFQVKYDVEVAICNLAEKLQEDSQLFGPCIDDFRLVFQDPVDCNKVRILNTPPPNVIAGSLEIFKDKWKKVKDENGKLVLSSSALKVLSELEPHILNGCCSDIPTFPNGIERKDFQFRLRQKVNNCRLGIPVMVAIATIALHEHNTARQEELGRDTAPVLLVVPDEGKNTPDALSGLPLGNANLQCLTVEVNMNKALESIASSQSKAEKSAEEIDARSLITAVDEYFSNIKKESDDHDYEAKSDQRVEEIIIRRALMFLRYHESASQTVPSAYVPEKLVPFLTCAFPLLMQEKFVEDYKVRSDAIKHVMEKFTGLAAMTGDENNVTENKKSQEDNFFHALAIVLESCIRKSEDLDNMEGDAGAFKDAHDASAFKDALKELNIDLDMNSDEIFSKLKDQVKKKIQVDEKKEKPENGSNEEETETEDDEGEKEIDEGEFEILVRETANVLSAQISIISTSDFFPVVPIFPQKIYIWSPNLFIFCSGGRFIPIVEKDLLAADSSESTNKQDEEESKESDVKKPNPNIKCKCGRGNPSITVGKCYTHEKSRYITRCVCFRIQQACTSSCDCRNCHNTFGCRPEKTRRRRQSKPEKTTAQIDAPPFKRRRHSHHHATMSKDLVAENFQTGAGLEVSLGKWSTTEKFLFEALISELKTEEESLTTELVAQKFNNIVQVASNIPGLQDLVGFKTPTQVNERLKEREKDVEAYLQMYQKQLDLLIKNELEAEKAAEDGQD